MLTDEASENLLMLLEVAGRDAGRNFLRIGYCSQAKFEAHFDQGSAIESHLRRDLVCCERNVRWTASCDKVKVRLAVPSGRLDAASLSRRECDAYCLAQL
jgi:hypothetical protein